MALAFKKAFLNFTLLDEAGNRSSMRYDLDYADLAALSTAWTAGDITTIATDLAAVTDALLAGYNVGVQFEEDTAEVGASGSEVENVALISAKLTGFVNKRVSLRIPAPVVGIFEDTQGEGKNIVDTSDAALQAYLAHMEASGVIEVSDGESIKDSATAGTFKGKRIHRASTRG